MLLVADQTTQPKTGRKIFNFAEKPLSFFNKLN